MRGADGDRRLTRYEVTQLLLNRTQPTFDSEAVPAARYSDLDRRVTELVVDRATDRSHRAFGDLAGLQVLRMLGAVTELGGEVVPTLAGLLCLGRYPQQFFPQLFVSFVALPHTSMGETAPDGAQFLDNQTIDGSLPEMLTGTVAAVQRNMSRAAIIRGVGREDRYDYPLEVIRELVANALMHRDLSPESRGTQVQVELYPDRLIITSPGGLHGGISPDALTSGEQISTSRNASLAKLLADVPMPGRSNETMCENRGSGLLRVMAALRAAGMSPPEFLVTLSQVRVTVPRHALLSPETVDWIGTLGLGGLTDEQHLALAMMRNAGVASSGMLQSWGVEAARAGRALRDLVARGVATRDGGKRYARYRLLDSGSSQSELPGLFGSERPDAEPAGPSADVVEAVRAGVVTTRGIASLLSVSYQAALRRVNNAVAMGLIEPTRPPRSSKQSYRLPTSPRSAD